MGSTVTMVGTLSVPAVSRTAYTARFSTLNANTGLEGGCVTTSSGRTSSSLSSQTRQGSSNTAANTSLRSRSWPQPLVKVLGVLASVAAVFFLVA